jgi:hypothetical protein
VCSSRRASLSRFGGCATLTSARAYLPGHVYGFFVREDARRISGREQVFPVTTYGDTGRTGAVRTWTSRPQGFVDALQGAQASKGIIFTASTFSSDAREYAATVSPRVILIDGERLAELMIDHNVGVAPREVYEVKRVDRDYFGDDA